MPAIPERWEKYLPLGKTIRGTRFVAFKVPLKEALCTALPENLKFTPAILLDKIQNLGLIVDLTNTSRYYNADQEFVNRGVKYRKINCVGHAVPSVQVVQSFYSTIDEFIKEYPANDQLIGVHCTHGVNRTGYLICSYMINRMGFQPTNAIQEFNKARGFSIERSNYIQSLNASIPNTKEGQQRRKRDRNRPPPDCPPPPSKRILRDRPPPQNLETEDSIGQYQHRQRYHSMGQQYPPPPPHYPPPPQHYRPSFQPRQQFHQPRQEFHRPQQQFHPRQQHQQQPPFYPQQQYQSPPRFPPRHQGFFNGPPNVPANRNTWRRPGPAGSSTHLRFDD